MSPDLSAAEEAHVHKVRRFFEEDYPRDLIDKFRGGDVLVREDHVRSQEALQERGWLGVGWPAENGGPGWSATERYLFEQELERAGAPAIVPMAVTYVGPIICTFGTAEQKKRWLPDILQSRAFWAQGYSEPEAGSDLASLRMRAERDGSDYVLNGTKTWTSGAHMSDWIFCLVRTSGELCDKDGISMICVPLDSPGVRVDPIISIDGTHELNSVTFEAVRTPVANRIGEEGKGWHYATVLLAAERVSYAHIGRKKADLAAMRSFAQTVPGVCDKSMLDDPAFAIRLAELEIETELAEISVLRALRENVDKATVSSLKIICTELAQDISALWLDLAGRDRLLAVDRSLPHWREGITQRQRMAVPRTASYLFERAQSIYGGTNEIQHNIIWRQLTRGLLAQN